ncbi:MAG: MBOAT family protein [Anaerotruncus sp.]|nr:MBOAT family protein [Anaerotruncus sp.]
MIFANLLFLYLFLPLNLLLYFLFKSVVYRNIVLIVFSFLFYAWGEPVWFLLLLFTAMIDYVHGQLIGRYRGTWIAHAALISSLVVNLGILVTFKYSGFFIGNLNAIFGTALPVPTFSLPIGISFYTFQTISYVVDVYHGEVEPQDNPFWYLLYLSMYHQLVAGPVVRYADINREICGRRVSAAEFSEGLSRFMFGLAKKVLIANVAGEFAIEYMEGNLARLSVGGAWFGAIMFSLQIYYDFSGYSDMAIGLGRIFGFHYKENFNYPYAATSVTDFWRRWHISLGSFFRDYVYIPLGGNRRHQYFNLVIVWFLTGFWHGASWNFILWGLYFGLFLLLEKRFFLHKLEQLPRAVGHIYLLFVAVVSWVIFYFTDLGRLGTYLKIMFGLSGRPIWDSRIGVVVMNNIFWMLIALVFCMPLVRLFQRFVAQGLGDKQVLVLRCCQVPLNFTLLLLCTAKLVGQSYNPFLYYRF